MPKPTKYYSTTQERRIADFFGWKTVSASGARPFHPGDVRSDQWLAECKTHIKEIDRLTVSKSVWRKLANEARSLHKLPVLFIDNGTQKIDDTWAVVFSRCIDDKGFETVTGPMVDSEGQLSFRHSDLKPLFRGRKASLPFFIDSTSLCIVRAVDLQEVAGDY